MNKHKQLASAFRSKANDGPFMTALRRKVINAAREEARQAFAIASEEERQEIIALIYEIETALAHVEIMLSLADAPNLAERVRNRRGRAATIGHPSEGPGHG